MTRPLFWSLSLAACLAAWAVLILVIVRGLSQ